MCAVVACGAAVAVFGLAAGMRLGNGRPTPTAPGPPSLSEPVPATSSAISSAGSPAAETSHGGSAFDGWSELAKTVVLVMACPGSGLAVDVDCSSGSGTVVGDGRHVLTNHHVVYADGAPHRYLYVWFADSFDVPPSRRAAARIVRADQRRDIAVLALDETTAAGRGVEPIPLPETHLDLGEQITILGYPGDGGSRITLTKGVFSGISTDPQTGVDYLKTDTNISSGNSGGAAFNSRGEFVGVPTASVGEVGWLIPSGEAARFVDAAIGGRRNG